MLIHDLDITVYVVDITVCNTCMYVNYFVNVFLINVKNYVIESFKHIISSQNFNSNSK